MKDVIFGIQKYTLINGEEIPHGRARIFYNGNAEKVANEYIEEYAALNGYIEIEHGIFNDRLFQHGIHHIELFKLESEHFVHNCA